MGAEGEEVVVTLSGGAPWGFRLQGGSEQKRPLQVSKIRKRSKACRGGLWENDELVSINGKPCASLSHASAMQIIDSSNGILSIVVKRATAGDSTSARLLRSPSPKQGRAGSPASPLHQATQALSPDPPAAPVAPPPEQQSRWRRQLDNLTSPPDSEAYYAETDSDADNVAQEKHRRARKKSPRSPPEVQNNKAVEPQDEVSLSELSGYESTPEAVTQTQDGGDGPTGVAKREIVCQPGSRTDTPFSESEALLELPLPEDREPSPEALLLPHATKTIRAERHLIPMVGPVEHPVDEDLTTTYAEKAKQAKLHRSESMQEKTVKEAKTKCRTIASLLTDAPNPHSKGVLMFKKRRQRAKKYTLVSFGSVDEDRCYDEEDGVFPTSESEFDEEGFSDARSLTNHSDWDSSYLAIEKPKAQAAQGAQGLSAASGRGAQLFEQQRQRASRHTGADAPAQEVEEQLPVPAFPQAPSMGTHETPTAPRVVKAPPNVPPEAVPGPSQLPTTSPAQLQSPTAVFGGGSPFPPSPSGLFNRSARPFTPGGSGPRPVTSSVVFRPSMLRKSHEVQGGPKRAVPPFSATSPGPAGLPCPPATVLPGSPASASVSLDLPTMPPRLQPSAAPCQSGSSAEAKPSSGTARTSTASIYLCHPARPTQGAAAPQASPPAPATASSSLYISPVPPQPSQPPAQPPARPASEPLACREQRVAVPGPRTGILQEARRRGSQKPMFKAVEEKQQNSPNPELLSLVQTLDEKPKGNQPGGAGFESGPEEDFLSLGAEACNFMQPSARRRLQPPPPVAPKPQQPKAPGSEWLANGASPAHALPQLKGRGAELFAKRQSRMDKFVVEAAPRPAPRARSPSPSPSLPSSWKYSPNIRAPPPIAYNPLHSPFYPLGASKAQPARAQAPAQKAPGQKSGIQAIDFLRHQPYQLKAAMFCFGESAAQAPTAQTAPQPGPSAPPAKQAPVKTARTREIRRFSTPAPAPTSGSLAPTVLAPRSATTLDEPIWRADRASSSSAPLSPGAFQGPPAQYQSSPELSQPGRGASPNPPSSVSSGFQVARPRFSAAQTGMQAHVWRPGSGHKW